MAAKCALLVVILAVNIIGHRATHCHVLCTGEHGHKPAERRNVPDDVSKQHAGLAGEDAATRIK